MSHVIALDAMGGDKAPLCVLEGAVRALKTHPGIRFLIYGQQDVVLPLIKASKPLIESSEFIHADDVVSADTKAVTALRSLKHSSMRLAIEAVATGKAQAVVSAGNTAAYVALSKMILKMIEGIDRPALPAILPSPHSSTILLDAGANLQCDADILTQFAVMGECFAQVLLGKTQPSVGILNVGSEDSKGHPVLQETAQMLRELSEFNFQGFVEGSDVPLGKTDVVVTDGFSGNLVLKAIEGTAHLVVTTLKKALSASPRGRLGYLMAQPAFKTFKKLMDPRLHNGTLFLGLKGLAVKSHGGMDGIGFANAVLVAVKMIDQKLIEKIMDRQGKRPLEND